VTELFELIITLKNRDCPLPQDLIKKLTLIIRLKLYPATLLDHLLKYRT